MNKFVFSIIMSCISLIIYILYDHKNKMYYINKEKMNTYIIIVTFTFSLSYFMGDLKNNTTNIPIIHNINNPKAPF